VRATHNLPERHVPRVFRLVDFRAGDILGKKLDGEVGFRGHHPRPLEADALDDLNHAIIRGQFHILLVPGKQALNGHHIRPAQLRGDQRRALLAAPRVNQIRLDAPAHASDQQRIQPEKRYQPQLAGRFQDVKHGVVAFEGKVPRDRAAQHDNVSPDGRILF
jgi:hypothetical protein